MTANEKVDEVLKDFNWGEERLPGLSRKYNKAIKATRKRKGQVFLGETHYNTPRNNKLILLNLAENGESSAIMVFEQPVQVKDGGVLRNYVQYIVPSRPTTFSRLTGQKAGRGTVYTHHFVSRLKERANMTLFDLLMESDFTGTLALESGQQAEYSKKGMIIYDAEDRVLVARTFIGRNQLFKNQIDFEPTAEQHKQAYREYLQDTKQL